MIHPQPTHFLKNNKKEKRLCFFKQLHEIVSDPIWPILTKRSGWKSFAFIQCQCLQKKKLHMLAITRLAQIN